MESLDYWRVCEQLSVVQAALLIFNQDPSRMGEVDIEDWWDAPEGFSAIYAALQGAILSGKLKADGTFIEVKDLKEWLSERRIPSEFFLPAGLPNADPLHSSYPDFSPKLKAAIAATMAVRADRTLTEGKSVKKALTTWLKVEENAARLGLLNPDGTVNTYGIGEIAKVANWETKGGVPKTPAKPTPRFRRKRR